MTPIVSCHEAADLTRFAPPPQWPKLTGAAWTRTRPDIHWLWRGRNDTVLARCSAWWTRVAPLQGHRLGYLGHFAATDLAAGVNLLRHSLASLETQGVSLAVGPIDGSTWEPYRYVVASDGSPEFLLEPQHPVDWPNCFAAAGFAPWAHYCSAICEDFTRPCRLAAQLEARLSGRAIARLRPLDPTRWPQELQTLCRLSSACFAHGFLFSPTSEAAFVERYTELAPHLDPDLIWIAERDDAPTGFLFCVPDRLRDTVARPNDRLIVKTLAVLQQPGSAGLSLLLMRRALQAAAERGYRRAVLALMHEQNVSSRMARNRMNAHVFRRYALFAKRLSNSAPPRTGGSDLPR